MNASHRRCSIIQVRLAENQEQEGGLGGEHPTADRSRVAHACMAVPQAEPSYECVAGQGVAARCSVRRPGPEMIPLTSVMRRTSVASEADMKPGNRKGTNPGPPDRTGRTRRIVIVLGTPPPVLNGTAANCGPPFGTKRPQVQILSPRPVETFFPTLRGIGKEERGGNK